MIKTIFFFVLAMFPFHCINAEQDDVDHYLSATENEKALDLEKLQSFVEVFENLDDEMLEQRIQTAYAEDIYFNDTLITLYNRDALIEYLKTTGEKANFVKTTILDVAQSNDDMYVKWLLEMEFEVFGKKRLSRSVGMSHLRFDEDGKIYLQQDFWDSASGLYRHMPVVGGLISWVKKRIHR